MMRTDHKVALAVALMLLALAGYSLASMRTLSQAEEAQVLRIRWAEPPQMAHVRRAEVPGLIIPVEGVRRAALSDSWGAPRDGGRTHKGIDIRADKGVPVLAAASGKIIKLFTSKRGGTTVYQADATGHFIFYYAHLDRYAAGLKVGQRVAQGDTIAYVGKTGNAPFPHLHFEIQKANPARQWWRGVAFNPYPVLVSGRFDLARASMLPKTDAFSP
jgi:murein DD-endopeptidase MepM/ murein hydrolase activator NlpD